MRQIRIEGKSATRQSEIDSYVDPIDTKPKYKNTMEEFTSKQDEYRNYALLNGKIQSFHDVIETRNDPE